MSPIYTELVNSSSPAEKQQALIDFAATFKHTICWRFSYVVFKDVSGKWLGHLAILNVPIAVAAVHPNTPKKQVVEILRMMEGHAKIQYGDSFVAAPTDSPLIPYLENRGYDPLGLELFYTT